MQEVYLQTFIEGNKNQVVQRGAEESLHDGQTHNDSIKTLAI